MESCPVQGVVSWAARGLCATVTGTFLAQPALVSVGSALEAHFWVGATNTSAFTLAGCLVCFSLIWSSVVNLLFYSLFPVSVEKHRVLRVRYVPVHAWPGLCVNNTLLLPWPRGASPSVPRGREPCSVVFPAGQAVPTVRWHTGVLPVPVLMTRCPRCWSGEWDGSRFLRSVPAAPPGRGSPAGRSAGFPCTVRASLPPLLFLAHSSGADALLPVLLPRGL